MWTFIFFNWKFWVSHWPEIYIKHNAFKDTVEKGTYLYMKNMNAARICLYYYYYLKCLCIFTIREDRFRYFPSHSPEPSNRHNIACVIWLHTHNLLSFLIQSFVYLNLTLIKIFLIQCPNFKNKFKQFWGSSIATGIGCRSASSVINYTLIYFS